MNDACLGNDTCAEGYQGILCETCDLKNDYAPKGYLCHSCDSDFRVYAKIFLICFVEFVIIVNQVIGVKSRI